jgi:hypothetical protein
MPWQVCWPWNTLVQPGNSYSMSVQAQSSVIDALGWQVRMCGCGRDILQMLGQRGTKPLPCAELLLESACCV